MQKIKPGVPPIEAFVISVVLGIVGVTAFGQFQDLSTGRSGANHLGIDARTSSAAAINYAARILEPPASAAQQPGVGECSGSTAGTRSAAFPSDYDLAAYPADEAGITCP
jgi:hypothetical protein